IERRSQFRISSWHRRNTLRLFSKICSSNNPDTSIHKVGVRVLIPIEINTIIEVFRTWRYDPRYKYLLFRDCKAKTIRYTESDITWRHNMISSFGATNYFNCFHLYNTLYIVDAQTIV